MGQDDELWRQVWEGTHPVLYWGRRGFGLLPSPPRCKLCNMPFRGVGGAIIQVFAGKRPSVMNPHLCNTCETYARTHPGGAEVALTMLFADIRGSTALAESLGTTAFTAVIDRFYRAATDVLFRTDAMINRLLGDEIVALFLPGYVGKDHASQAVKTAQALLRATGHGEPDGPWVPVGAGIHTGRAFVGTVGTPGSATDFTALGDDVNLTARLAAAAGAGEILVSDATRGAALLSTDLEQRRLAVKGKSEPIDVWVVGAGVPEPVPAPPH
ncbi:MAG TPA: adenylate/guanylate cyclase domain-containing protein [Chloroflexota bacterium]